MVMCAYPLPVNLLQTFKGTLTIPLVSVSFLSVGGANLNRMKELQKEILDDIKRIEIDCPECKWMEDDQYTCATCWCQGGNGKINVFQWLKNHPSALENEA